MSLVLVKHSQTEAELMLVGHSMGGAVVAKAASRIATQKDKLMPASDDGSSIPINPSKIVAVVLLDVCEEIAIASLEASKNFAKRLPKKFPSLDFAIEWAACHMVANRLSAQISTPPMLYYDEQEDSWLWKVNLVDTEKYWEEWFKGMNKAWLSPGALSCHKILISSAIHSVDNELAVAQMQGKIQVEVLAKTGHIIHEDQSEAVADIILGVVHRQKRLQRILNEQKIKRQEEAAG